MVFLMYPITCINAFQCSIPGLDWKRESNDTEKARSGRVASWPHITEPSTGRYGLSNINFLSNSVLGDILLSRVRPTGNEVFFGMTWVRKKRLRTCSQ